MPQPLAPPLTKPGRHGTLHRYAIDYNDGYGDRERHVWHCWAYSPEHAMDKFDESTAEDGGVALSEPRLVRDRGRR